MRFPIAPGKRRYRKVTSHGSRIPPVICRSRNEQRVLAKAPVTVLGSQRRLPRPPPSPLTALSAGYDRPVGPQLPQISFEIVAECPHTRARAGLLHTPHGTVETPAFMPVGTQATVKGLTQRDLAEDLGVGILLANTYHLFLRPGHELIRQMGGLHKFMSWPNAILTDSGGFQVFSLSGLRQMDEAGVVFSSHLDGDRHAFTPESTVDVQLAFGSDILMVLDECPEYPVSHEAACQSMRRTVRWATQANRHFLRRMAESPTRHALFPIVQGSMFEIGRAHV